MSQVKLSPNASRNLEHLRRFLLEKNPNIAKMAMKAIREGIKILQTHPLAFRNKDESGLIKELTIPFGASGYIALYRYNQETDIVDILAIKHQREGVYTKDNAVND